MLTHRPDFVVKQDLPSTEVQVNVLSGSAANRTRMRARGHGDWIEKQHIDCTDSDYEKLKKHTDLEAKRIGYKRYDVQQPFRTDHHWAAVLPAGLSEGVRTVEVETTGLYGQTWCDVWPILAVDRPERIEQLHRYNIRKPIRKTAGE